MNRTIIPTRPGDEHFHLFESLPSLIYLGDSIRLKQRDSIQQEFLHSCFVLAVKDKPVGRLTLYFNPFLRYNGQPAACIGNYECIEDHTAGEELMKHAESIAKNNAYNYIIGPMNGSTWDNYRLSTHNEHRNFFLEPYHHLYYNHHFTNAGYKPVANYVSLIDRKLSHEFDTVYAREKELTEQGVTFRNIDLSNYEDELYRLHSFSMHAFSNNFLFTPLKAGTFISKYLPLREIIKPEHVIIAEHEGNVKGFVFCIDDLYSEEPVLILKTIARSMSKTYSGLGNVLANRITRYAKNNGYKSIIHAFIIHNNVSYTRSKEYSGEPYKEYVLYGKSL